MDRIPFSLIFVAGGVGKRMGSETPKQFITLQNKPIAIHSFEVFLSMPEIKEIVVVCDPKFQSLFLKSAGNVSVRFAQPGKERQDSVYNGLQEIKKNDGLICIHDSARPFIDTSIVRKVVKEAYVHGSAALGAKVKLTIKVCDNDQFVVNTPSRSSLWEMQTPQIVPLEILKKGFKLIQEKGIVATDDVYIAELLSHPIKIVEGEYKNIKITTPEDLKLAEQLIKDHEFL